MRQLSVLGLESVFLPDEDYGYTSRLPGTSGNDSLAADTVIALAVSAETCDRAGGFGTNPDTVGRSSNVPHPADAIFQTGNYFVHACDDQYVGRAVYETGNPVADTIYVDQFPFSGDGVGTHKEIVGCNDFAV